MKPWFSNPAALDQKIYMIADVPHLLKLIRNHFVDSGFIIDKEELKKEIIEELIAKTNKKSDLSIAYKITMDSLLVKNSA